VHEKNLMILKKQIILFCKALFYKKQKVKKVPTY